MHRKPNHFFGCAFDPMFFVSWDQKIIAGIHGHGFAVRELQLCRSLDHHDPFIMILIIPETRRT